MPGVCVGFIVIHVCTPVVGIMRLVVKLLWGILYRLELVGVRANTSMYFEAGCKWMPFVMPCRVMALVDTFGNNVSTRFCVGNMRQVLPPDYTHYNGMMVS